MVEEIDTSLENDCTLGRDVAAIVWEEGVPADGKRRTSAGGNRHGAQ